MHDNQSAAGPNGKPLTTPELSPRSTPHSSQKQPGEREIRAAEPYNPFASVEDVPLEGSIYSPPGYMTERLDDGEIKFGNVDWQVKRPEPTRTRTVSNMEEVKLDGPPSKSNPPKPPFYRPADSPPIKANSPPYLAAKTGQNLSADREHWVSPLHPPLVKKPSNNTFQSPINEKAQSDVTTPPLTYYHPNKQENFRTNLDDEKHSWDQSRHSSDLQPFPEFEDVELARPKARGLAPNLPAQVPMQVVRVRSERRSAACFYIVCALIFLVPLGIALGVFGGVYHWNIRDERCAMTGGSWHGDSKTCQYR